MAKQQSMEELSVEEIISKYNLIVPEIQREYVWGYNDHKIIDSFIKDIKDGMQSSKTVETSSEELTLLNRLYEKASSAEKVSFKKLIDQIKVDNSINIGFLYSYRPDYYVFNDRNEDVYLIDGQQRFTTLFLLLFYFSLRESRYDEFIELFRFDRELEKIAFDYRVRTLTHNFLIDLISNCKVYSDLAEINKKTWFLSNYQHDVTIKGIVGYDSKPNSIAGAFKLFRDSFETDENNYFDYVKSQIKFWHFKTEETSQGEELYITMNSRGQQLSDNETIRAILFEDEIIKYNQMEWSERWEKWQDFFWKNRNKANSSANADKGLNEFLRWVQIISMVESQEIKTDDDDENSVDKRDITNVIKWSKGSKLNAAFLSLNEIEKYFNALEYLYEGFIAESEDLKKNYGQYKQFNLLNKQWLSPVNSDSIDQIDCFRLLPVLYYCKLLMEKGLTYDTLDVFRVIRFFYNLRQDATVFKTASVQCINALKLVKQLVENSVDIIDIQNCKGVSKTILNAEEKNKFSFYQNADREKWEDIFWLAEDYRLNEGKISHLIRKYNTLKTIEPEKNGVQLFNQLFKAYKNLGDNEELIWGNLLVTNVYHESADRVVSISDWAVSEGFLTLTEERYKDLAVDLKEFIKRQHVKYLSSNYATESAIKNETLLKKQLYLYYVLHSQVLNKWDWRDRWNFGVYDWIDYTQYKSMFVDKKIFQFYKAQWRFNEGYKVGSGIWLQENFEKDRNYTSELFAWYKSKLN